MKIEPWGRSPAAGTWPHPTPVWTLAALLLALATVALVAVYRYHAVWTPLQRAYAPAYLRCVVMAAVRVTRTGRSRLLEVETAAGFRLALAGRRPRAVRAEPGPDPHPDPELPVVGDGPGAGRPLTPAIGNVNLWLTSRQRPGNLSSTKSVEERVHCVAATDPLSRVFAALADPIRRGHGGPPRRGRRQRRRAGRAARGERAGGVQAPPCAAGRGLVSRTDGVATVPRRTSRRRSSTS